MTEHRVTIAWTTTASGDDFRNGRYSREHMWSFDGGLTIPGSPSLSNVPAPWANPAYVDPEEAYVAAISSCHMLTFLWIAAQAGFVVEAYRDEAVGTIATTLRGADWIDRVILAPQITYAADHRPTATESDRLHHAAHEQCLIANSVKTEIVVAAR